MSRESARLCAAQPDEASCNQHLVECAFERTRESCAPAPGAEPASCAAHCAPHAGRCEEALGCEAVFPDDGRSTHENADIIACRHRDGVDRCLLVTTPAGTKVCEYRESMNPCRGCTRTFTGKCVARRPSTFG